MNPKYGLKDALGTIKKTLNSRTRKNGSECDEERVQGHLL
jgi:hypothetical protein